MNGGMFHIRDWSLRSEIPWDTNPGPSGGGGESGGRGGLPSGGETVVEC